MWSLLGLLVLGTPPLAGEVRGQAGLELDTNALRAVPNLPEDAVTDVSRPERVAADALVRVLVEASGTWTPKPEHRFHGRLGLGAKRFFVEGTEDLAAVGLALGSRHRWGPLWGAAFTEGRVSRIRNGLRDFEFGLGGVELGWLLGPTEWLMRGQVVGFGFPVERRFDHVSPVLTAEVGWRPEPRWRIFGTGSWLERRYAGNGLVLGEPLRPELRRILTFCEDPAELAERGFSCSSEPRVDEEVQVGFGVEVRGPWLGELRYLFRRQRSSSPLENVDRHRVVGALTLALPFRIDLGTQAALQVSDGVSLTDQQLLAEDDENQTWVRVLLRRPIDGPVHVELRWALYANQFGNVEASFLRQTVSVGVAIQLESRGGPSPQPGSW